MGDIVPINKQAERELVRIKADIDSYAKWFKQTHLSHPRTFDATNYIRRPNATKSELCERAGRELWEQAGRELLREGVRVMREMARRFG